MASAKTSSVAVVCGKSCVCWDWPWLSPPDSFRGRSCSCMCIWDLNSATARWVLSSAMMAKRDLSVTSRDRPLHEAVNGSQSTAASIDGFHSPMRSLEAAM
mmetsp:Transcript_31030/g.92174  ORF Transcript_31030/g.92174 Transcript_31030/m.92174 type:complete len:101 (-) Transcript_31030:71-373(-)